MTRFIVISFAFLAWLFWELSGGASYAPRVDAVPDAPPEDRRIAAPAERGVTPLDRASIAARAPQDLSAQTPAPAPAPSLFQEPVEQAATETASTREAPVAGTGPAVDPIASAISNAVSEALDTAAQDAPDPLAEETPAPRLSDALLGVPQDDSLSRLGLAGLGLDGLGSATDATGGLDLRGLDAGEEVTGALTGQTITRAPSGSREAEASDPAFDLREISAERVNMRAGPGTDFSVLATLSRGVPVEVLSEGADGWLRLRVVDTGEIGYMANWLVSSRTE